MFSIVCLFLFCLQDPYVDKHLVKTKVLRPLIWMLKVHFFCVFEFFFVKLLSHLVLFSQLFLSFIFFFYVFKLPFFCAKNPSSWSIIAAEMRFALLLLLPLLHVLLGCTYTARSTAVPFCCMQRMQESPIACKRAPKQHFKLCRLYELCGAVRAARAVYVHCRARASRRALLLLLQRCYCCCCCLASVCGGQTASFFFVFSFFRKTSCPLPLLLVDLEALCFLAPFWTVFLSYVLRGCRCPWGPCLYTWEARAALLLLHSSKTL